MTITQCMRDSIVGDEWIKEASALNPVTPLGDGVFLSGLVRLGYVSLFKPSKYKGGGGGPAPAAAQSQQPGDGKYQATLMFTPFSNVQLIEAEAVKLGAAAFPSCYSGGRLFGVPIPLRDQGERANKAGFTAGLKFLTASSSSKPIVYDRPPSQTLVTEAESWKAYSGMWAVVHFRLYVPKGWQRVACGLNAVTLFADDTKLGEGGGPNEEALRQQMSGIRAATPIAVPNMAAPPVAPYAAPQQAPLSDADYLKQMGF